MKQHYPTVTAVIANVEHLLGEFAVLPPIGGEFTLDGVAYSPTRYQFEHNQAADTYAVRMDLIAAD